MHKHHIIPRHAGGSNDSSNIKLLTIPDHAEAHRLLFEQHGRWQDEVAYRMLSGQISAAEATLLAIKKALTGVKQTPEHIARMVATKIGKSYEELLGKEKAKELREKRSVQSKKNWADPLFREVISQKAKEAWNNPELRKRMSKKPSDTKNYSSAAITRHANPIHKEKHRQAVIASWQKRRMGE
jgi:hypothetical protein